MLIHFIVIDFHNSFILIIYCIHRLLSFFKILLCIWCLSWVISNRKLFVSLSWEFNTRGNITIFILIYIYMGGSFTLNFVQNLPLDEVGTINTSCMRILELLVSCLSEKSFTFSLHNFGNVSLQVFVFVFIKLKASNGEYWSHTRPNRLEPDTGSWCCTSPSRAKVSLRNQYSKILALTWG